MSRAKKQAEEKQNRYPELTFDGMKDMFSDIKLAKENYILICARIGEPRKTPTGIILPEGVDRTQMAGFHDLYMPETWSVIATKSDIVKVGDNILTIKWEQVQNLIELKFVRNGYVAVIFPHFAVSCIVDKEVMAINMIDKLNQGEA